MLSKNYHAEFESLRSDLKVNVILIGIIFSAFLILSNLAAVKMAAIGQFNFPAGLIFFPVTYIFDDILTEVYGFKVSRIVIWSALMANIIVFTGTWLTTFLQPSPYWHDQSSYEIIYRTAPRIFIASTISYFFGEFVNSIILAKLKVISAGRYLWVRAITSSGIGVAIDTIIFIHIAFLFTFSYSAIWKVIGTMYLAKLIYEICALPFTYKMTNYLKMKDQVDYYDYKTKFNPFSLKI